MGDKVRVAIVGSGPAGLSAAAHAAQRGMSHILLEKTDHLSDTIFKYQKGKHVMATPSNLVLRSDLDFDAGKRETILDTWDRQIAEGQVNVRTNADVTAIAGSAGAFTLSLKDGSVIEAEAVVLAIGTAVEAIRAELAHNPEAEAILAMGRAAIRGLDENRVPKKGVFPKGY